MKTVIHKAGERGRAETGWLRSRHSFSFSNYFDPGKMGFGLLRVLNDDVVEPGTGFAAHSHDNMEIISIVLSGALEHKDSMGSSTLIKAGDVQVMSAGTGITHSEFNASKTERVNFLQLWIFPKEKDVNPRYDQKEFPEGKRRDELLTVVSGDSKKDALYIHQNAEIGLGLFTAGKKATHNITFPGNGFYLFMLDGKINAAGNIMGRRDALGVYDVDAISIEAIENSKFVLIEVPMK